MLKVKNLKKCYGDVKAVKDVNLHVCEGEIFGLLGPNGAGKSTTIECILGIKKKDWGDVELLGMDPVRDRKAIFEKVGVQFQESAYQDHIKVKEICTLTASFYEEVADWKSLLGEFGLEGKGNQMVSSLSGGERQKLSVLLAFIAKPKIVFLDELTTGLDPRARRDMWKYIDLLRKRGITVFLTSHFMDEAEHLCDRVSIMKKGEVVICDTVENVIKQSEAQHVITVKMDPCDPALFDGMQGVVSTHKEGDVLSIYGDNGLQLIDVVRKLDDANVSIEELNMKKPNLEDAYLYFTGEGEEK